MDEELSDLERILLRIRKKLRELGIPVTLHPMTEEQKEEMKKVVERNKLKIEDFARTCTLFNKNTLDICDECPIHTVCWEVAEREKKIENLSKILEFESESVEEDVE